MDMRGLAVLYHPSALWPFGGSERRFAQVARYLKEYGVEFDAIEPSPPLYQFMPIYYNSHVVNFSFRNQIYVDLPEWIIRGLRKVKELCRNDKYNFVYATNNNTYNFLLGYLSSRMFSLPLVVVVHHLRWVDPCDPIRSDKPDIFSTYGKMRQNKLSRLNALAQTLGAIIESKVGRAELCITVSQSVAENLKALGVCRKKIAVTGNAVDFNYINSFPNDKKRYDAVFVGRLDEGKGICDLIETWKRVVETFPHAKLVVIGSGLLRKVALNVTENLGLENNIKFMSFVTDECVYHTLSASRIFVLPSKMEGWSIATAEALTRGLPAVCYDIPPIRETYGECQSVFLVPIGDIKALAERIIWLLSLTQANYTAQKQISQNYVKRFDWHEVALKEYQALVKAT